MTQEAAQSGQLHVKIVGGTVTTQSSAARICAVPFVTDGRRVMREQEQVTPKLVNSVPLQPRTAVPDANAALPERALTCTDFRSWEVFSHLEQALPHTRREGVTLVEAEPCVFTPWQRNEDRKFHGLDTT